MKTFRFVYSGQDILIRAKGLEEALQLFLERYRKQNRRMEITELLITELES
ncbi:MAG: hypothetical protein BWY50_01867 [Spirochaetes bacterium ADurb.Bin315]|nr:MAG: hypothetical protein BWY50_01867 [Spirochaetes bacterium ADurb.Bin315]